jgi:predicted lipoprotein with Yx(FWY)xxD motif
MRLNTKYSATAVLAAGLAALVLAACGGSNSSSGSSGSSGSASTMGTSGGVVSVKSVGKSDVLTNAQGKTLYTANVEKGGKIMCTSGCTSIWMPADGSASQAKTAAADLNLKVGVVKRPDGTDQLTLNGQPLYSFTQEGAGKLAGNGAMDAFNGTQFTWSAATTGGTQAASTSGSNSSSGGGSTYPGY